LYIGQKLNQVLKMSAFGTNASWQTTTPFIDSFINDSLLHPHTIPESDAASVFLGNLTAKDLLKLRVHF